MNITPDCGFLFDLDGVLIDSEGEYLKIWEEINRQFPTGIDNLPIIIKGMTLTNILNQYFSVEQHKGVIDLLYRLESRMKYNWLPGAEELLKELQKRSIPTALVTSSDDKKMAHLREEQPKLESYFTAIVTANRISRSKPDPEGYLLGAEIIGCKPNKCIVFEDSYQGVQAGKAAGAFVVGVEGTLSAERIEPFSNIIVNTLTKIDIDDLIEKINNNI